MPRQSITLILLFLFSFPAAFVAEGKNPKTPAKPQALSDHDRALHALERLTFGPRPGDIEKVLLLGADNWIEQQLNPGHLPNANLDSRLAPYRTLRMQPRELVLAFPEGGAGAHKPVRERYRLREFAAVPVLAAAVAARVPIIPVAVVGSEEAAPVVARLTARLPIASPLPLPAKFIIRFLEAVRPQAPPAGGDGGELCQRVRDRIQDSLDEMLSRRRSAWYSSPEAGR